MDIVSKNNSENQLFNFKNKFPQTGNKINEIKKKTFCLFFRTFFPNVVVCHLFPISTGKKFQSGATESSVIHL